jgi:hypothetical protein
MNSSEQNQMNVSAPIAQKKIFVCPSDPAELAQCDECQ